MRSASFGDRGWRDASERLWSIPRKIRTAAELEKLSRTEQQRIFDGSIVTDLAAVAPEFLERIRADARRHISEHEASDTP